MTIVIWKRLAKAILTYEKVVNNLRITLIQCMWSVAQENQWVRADFLSSQKLLYAMFLQKKSIIQELAANILIRISVVKIVCECFLPWQETGKPKGAADFLCQ